MFRGLFLFVVCLTTTVVSLQPGWLMRRFKLQSSKVYPENAEVAVSTGYFEQNIDHFVNATGTFSQKYFFSRQFATNKKRAFLVVGDEGFIEAGVLSDESNPIVKNAKQFGAATFALEHRYFGDSKPFSTLSTENLRFLNTLQAIQDVGSFIKYANVQFNLDSDVRWVLFGVGYGGFVAAQARLWFPTLVTGVISSSTPMQHKDDFWEFNELVETSINSATGSPDCSNNIRAAFKDIAAALLSAEGRSNVSTYFNLYPRFEATNLTYNDIQTFYLQAISPFDDVVMFHNQFGINIQGMCQVMANTSNVPIQNVRAVYDYVFGIFGVRNQPILVSYPILVNLLSNENVNGNNNVDQRASWYYTCTEFGYFYTTNSDENGLFGASLPASWYINFCRDIFPGAQLSATKIRDLVEDYNNFYKSYDGYSGTNAVFTDGSLDPIRLLGKERATDFSVVRYIIENAGYASDLFPTDSNNSHVDVAHQIFAENINKWFNSPLNPVTHVNTSVPWTRPPFWYKEPTRAERNEIFTELDDDIPSKKTYPKGGYKRVLLGRPPHGFKPAPDMEKLATYPPGYSEGFFRQRVDHFDNTNPNTFRQKFFKNAQWAKPGGPNFLMIGGEGPESSSWVLYDKITYLTWAQKYGATVYLLEHRYYGDSLVGDNTDLQYLSSLQMLYDVAEFIKAANSESGTSAPWITFGGSYSGAMSAWMREVFPDLVTGAVASSGPVFAKTDFYEYLMVVEDSIRTYSADCANNIKSAFDTMHELYQTREGRQYLTTAFTLDPPFNDTPTETDQHYFFSTIYSNFQGAVQYSGDNAGPYAYGYGIPDMCRIMLNSTNTPLQNVAAFNEYMTVFYYGGGTFAGTDNNYQNMVDYIKNASLYGPDSAASLLWTWQTCTEFGYFQSADSGNGIFGSPTPVNMFNQLCIDVFGARYNRGFIDLSVDHTNRKYGSRFHYRGSNVVLPNGNVDPWHALGLYHPVDQSVVPYLINGTAHCADMYPARDLDVPGLKIVRDLVDANIAKWLSGTPDISTTPSTTQSPTNTGSTLVPSNPTASSVTPTVPLTTTTQGSSVVSILVSITLCILKFSF